MFAYQASVVDVYAADGDGGGHPFQRHLDHLRLHLSRPDGSSPNFGNDLLKLAKLDPVSLS